MRVTVCICVAPTAPGRYLCGGGDRTVRTCRTYRSSSSGLDDRGDPLSQIGQVRGGFPVESPSAHCFAFGFLLLAAHGRTERGEHAAFVPGSTDGCVRGWCGRLRVFCGVSAAAEPLPYVSPLGVWGWSVGAARVPGGGWGCPRFAARVPCRRRSGSMGGGWPVA